MSESTYARTRADLRNEVDGIANWASSQLNRLWWDIQECQKRHSEIIADLRRQLDELYTDVGLWVDMQPALTEQQPADRQ